ncbi:hypothetical protein HDU67_005255 [Dinochytrium kinnereticum]|nr:hypothetical protein HDU67_005255 [Dinochytrium kinnereticum]
MTSIGALATAAITASSPGSIPSDCAILKDLFFPDTVPPWGTDLGSGCCGYNTNRVAIACDSALKVTTARLTFLFTGNIGIVNRELPDIRRLQSLRVFECDFCGYSSVPDIFEGVLAQNLNTFRLYGVNARTSSFPKSISTLTNLATLYMPDTTGPLPDLSRLRRLTTCSLGRFAQNCIGFVDKDEFISQQPAACRAGMRRIPVCSGGG